MEPTILAAPSRIELARKSYDDAIDMRLRADPSVILPLKRYGNKWPSRSTALFLNYVAPSQYMRFVWTRLIIVLFSSLTGADKPITITYIPRSSLARRKMSATMRKKRLIFHETKVITTFHLGGGVGKTTVGLLTGLAIKRARPDLSVSILDCEEGTLIQRVQRTAIPSMLDILDNLQSIKHPSDLLRYCTIAAYGLKVIAWRREEQVDGAKEVSRDEITSVVNCVANHDHIVICDLAGGKTPKNRGVLDVTHQVQIVTTPAEDRLAQAVVSFSWLLANGYSHLAKTAIIVVNKCKSKKDIAKVKAEFEKTHMPYLQHVRFTAVYNNKVVGRGGKISLEMLKPRREVTLLENTATMLENLADSHIEEPASQLTHLEVERHGVQPRNDRRIAQKGVPTPFNEDKESMREIAQEVVQEALYPA
jgi:MinD-like ATPase involved in chromosome partitioning or flagellar assembly